MCGIAGWVDWEEDVTKQRAIVEAMGEVLRHRGPDCGCCWLSARAGFAFRRLIVIDPYTGDQPMLYREGERTYVIIYNGEVYNFRELRQELERKGNIFRTQSDTEVVLRAYVQWGEACPQHLNGIFAFGIWDESRQRLFLARDHLGVKPLFYAQRGSAILFASELKALLAHPLIKPEVDAEGLTEVLCCYPGYTPGMGFYRDVHELRPAHAAVFTRECMRVARYWSLQSAPHTDDVPTTVERIRALLEDALKRQLFADVPVVSLLSGGVDSSSLVALAGSEFAREKKTLRTYAIDFERSAQQFQSSTMRPSLDGPWAERVSQLVGTQHHTVTVSTKDLIDNLLVPLHAHDVPAMGQIGTSLYLLFRAMKQQATVGISGEASDEVFGGYAWFRDPETLTAPDFPWRILGFDEAARRQRHAWIAPEVRERIQPRAYMQRRYEEALAEVPRLPGEEALAARRRELFYLNLTRFLTALLDRKDRMSMAVGFEARVPFCDYRLVEYVWNIPWEVKMIDEIEKGILRRAVAHVLPDDVRMRRKSAYPVSQNPEYDQATKDWVLRIVHDPQAPVNQLLDRAVVLEKVRKQDPEPWVSRSLFEHIIQLNAWLTDYRVSIC